VLYPLPDITMHVIEPPGVRLQLPYRMRLPSSIITIPRIAPELARIIPKAPAGGGAGTRRVLPLRFCGQAVRRPAFSTIQPADELLHVVPGDLFDWAVRVTCEVAGIIPHHGLPLALRHLVLAQVKRLRDAHCMHGFLIVRRIAVVRPHLECPW